MPLLKLATLASLAALNNALFWMPPMRTYDLYYDEYLTRSGDVEPAPSSRWTVSADAYELKIRMPDLEPASLTAALASDGTKIEVVGERKIEGCSCRPSTVKEIGLPYRPRAEDIDMSVEKDVLSLRLARHAKADTATPLKVSMATQKDKDTSTETRPLRFVPHASAAEGDATASTPMSTPQDQDRTLTEKFRSAALASVAVQHEGAKEAAEPGSSDKTTGTPSSSPEPSSEAGGEGNHA
jgi:HSP20 family molecular chaperone IbpA